MAEQGSPWILPIKESKTSVSTFEDDFGDWVAGSSQNVTWKRTSLLRDHTHVDSYFQGYSMMAISYRGVPGTARIDTYIEFTQPICLSLWYQLYWNSFDCYFNIYQISDKKQTLLFSANHNFTSLGEWVNITIDFYGQDPFTIALEADFRYRDSEAVRAILIDDTSIAYRPCQELVTTIRYADENTVNISCWNTSQIQIQGIDVIVEETPCRGKPCVINSQDTQTFEDKCNGESSCLVDYIFTSACLREFRYFNLSYTCKHENGTSVSTFEEDYGDWVNVPSNNFKWTRSALVADHTRISNAVIGYSMTVISYDGTVSRARIDTDNEFIEPICLSLWYQLYTNCYDCAFSIYKISDGGPTLVFTAEDNSTSLGQWINISVDVYEQAPFRVTLEAHFKYNYSTAVRAILVDDTSIAYRPCQGQQVETTCLDMNTPIKIECETQFLAGDIQISLEPENFISQQKNCTKNSIESELNTFCRNFNKWDQCKFNVLDFVNGYEDCYVFSKHIAITYQCNDKSEGSEGTSVESSIQYDIIGIAAGVSGGILLTIIAAVVICRFRRSDGCDCVTKTITSLKRKGHESRINETGVYECSNISSRLSDHAYDSFGFANYDNMTHVPNSSTGGHHGNDRDLYINQ